MKKIINKTYKGFFVVCLLYFGFIAQAAPAQAQGLEENLTLDIPSLVKVLNQDRLKAGLHPLRRDPVLDEAAAQKAADMVREGYFAHTSPKGIDPWYWFNKVNYEYIYAGENLALDFNDPVAVQAAWMRSPKHRENILNENYEDVGYAIAIGTFSNINGVNKTKQGVIIVQLFGKRVPATASNNLANSNQVSQPISSPATAAQQVNDQPVIQKITSVVEDISQRVLNSSTDTESTPSLNPGKFQAATQNNQPIAPWTTWPAVSLGFAVLMLTAGLHGKFMV